MKKILFVSCFFLMFFILTAETDQVYLKNGQVIEGQVQNYESGKFVEIKKIDGKLQIINWDQIDSLNLGKENQQKPEDLKLDFNKKGISLDQTLASDQLRLNWQKQGGVIWGTEAAVNYISTKMDYSDSLSGSMKLDGAGLGYTTNLNMLIFSPPNYVEKKYHSSALKLGLSLGISANMFDTKYESTTIDTIPAIAIITNDVSIENDIRVGTIEFGLNLGANIGLGRFLNPQKWGGIILGIAWRPTWQWTSTTTTTTTDIWYEFDSLSPYIPNDFEWIYDKNQNTDDKTQFSWSAVELTLDIGGIKAMTDKLAKRAHFRLNFLYVPPVGDYNITMLYFGVGAVWYR